MWEWACVRTGLPAMAAPRCNCKTEVYLSRASAVLTHTHSHTGSTLLRRPHLADERRIQADLGIQHLGHRAAFLRLLAQFVELRLACARDLGFQHQMHGSNRKATVDLVQRHFGLGVDAVSLEAGVAQNHRKRHGEAAGVRRTNQFLRVCALAAFETGLEAVGRFAQYASFSGNGTQACLQITFPMRGCFFNDTHSGLLERWFCFSKVLRIEALAKFILSEKPSDPVGDFPSRY